MRIVALIPARAGSRRVPGKNLKPLGGKPLLQWTIEAARKAELFETVMVSTEDDATAEIAWFAGAMVDYRPPAMAQDDSPDIQWVQHALESLRIYQITPEAFSILRPTSPFRTAETIRRAVAEFKALPDWFGSLRAVERWDGPHPGKMWYVCGDYITPVDNRWEDGAPRHSSPTQTLPPVVRQNASLEIAWTECVTSGGTIAGNHVAPFFTEGWEGFDINTPEDFARAERHAATLLARV